MVPRDRFLEEVEESLIKECRGLSSAATIKHLVECGLISHPQSKAYLARKKIEDKIRQGLRKMEAMEAVADEMNCSYATIRNYTYNNYK